MKKTLLSIALVAAGLVAFAQKPAGGDMTLETQFSLNMGGPNGFTTPEIRYRYFLSEGLAARVRLGINSTSTTTNPQNAAGDKSAEIKTSQFGFNIGLGVEKHLAGTDKLSPYFGAELMYALVGASNVTATNSNDGATYTADGDKFETSGGANNNFGLKLLFGADYYFTDAVYLGGEMGWGFMMGSSADRTVKITSGGTAAPDATTKGGSNFTLGMMNFPTAAVRFGVKF